MFKRLLRSKPSKSIHHLPSVPQTSIDTQIPPQGYFAELINTLGVIADAIDSIDPKGFPGISWAPEDGTAKDQQRALCDMIVKKANEISEAGGSLPSGQEYPPSKVNAAKGFYNTIRNEFHRPLVKATSRRTAANAVQKRVYAEAELEMGDFEAKLEAVLDEVLESITSLQTLPEAPLDQVSLGTT